MCRSYCFFFFFFNDTATTEIYTLSLHDALPICQCRSRLALCAAWWGCRGAHGQGDALGTHTRYVLRGKEDQSGSRRGGPLLQDRKSTRLNSSHANISYAVFCLKKKKTKDTSQYL